MEYKDYYQTMGVARDATQEEIQRAYRKLSRKYHPDVSKEANAEARFKEVGEAYKVLKDPEARAAYDNLGSGHRAGQPFTPPPGWNQGFEQAGPGFHPFGEGLDGEEASDFFEALFGRMRGGGGEHAGHGFHTRGEDRHASIQIDLEDAYHGATRRLSLRIPELDGSGHLVQREHQVEFTIPRGMRAGQRIRLAGQGAPGSGKAPPGDLYLEVEFRKHPRFRVEQHDVYLDLPVAPWEAALGAEIEVAIPTGTVSLKVPPGSANGKLLRLKGRGIPSAKAGVADGDFFFVLQIATPPAQNDAQVKLYRDMATQFPDFQPRAGARSSA